MEKYFPEHSTSSLFTAGLLLAFPTVLTKTSREDQQSQRIESTQELEFFYLSAGLLAFNCMFLQNSTSNRSMNLPLWFSIGVKPKASRPAKRRFLKNAPSNQLLGLLVFPAGLPAGLCFRQGRPAGRFILHRRHRARVEES